MRFADADSPSRTEGKQVRITPKGSFQNPPLSRSHLSRRCRSRRMKGHVVDVGVMRVEGVSEQGVRGATGLHNVSVATCGNDHIVKLWCTADGRLVETLRGHDSHIYNVAFHPSGT